MGIAIVAGVHEEWLMFTLLLAAVVLGNLLVLPIGGADMPVVISLLNAFTGLSAAATGVALDNSALIVAGMLVGASGTLLTRQMAAAMNRSSSTRRPRCCSATRRPRSPTWPRSSSRSSAPPPPSSLAGRCWPLQRSICAGILSVGRWLLPILAAE